MTARRSGPPRVAVIGRQNVGKSTLVNRLAGRRAAIADDRPGVTRDRLEIEASWTGRDVILVDTAGDVRKARGVEALALAQADLAAEHADLVLLIVDGRTGVAEEDAALARRLRRAEVPVLVVANKVDAQVHEAELFAFRSLGLGEAVPVSALHGRGSGELLDRVVALLPERTESARPPDGIPAFAIVGRPNVGKSSLFNRLVGEERSVVYEEAGTTRDAIDAVIEWPDGPVRFVDTAGMRRGTKVRGVEYYSVLRALEAVDRADVVALVIDATEGFTGEDKRIATRVMQAGRAFVLVANKWDLVQDKDRVFKNLAETLAPFAGARVVRTSALRGTGVRRFPSQLTDLHTRWRRRAPTARINDLIQTAQAERPTPRAAGTLHYATQVSAGPPTFVIFGGSGDPGPSYRRYLENRIRREIGLEGVPIRLSFRTRRRARKRA